jgi:hypothetical protein
MSQLAIVNAPSSFTAIWAVMRPWLAKETVEKVSVLGSNYASTLLKLIDPESLPKSLGGECTCEDCGDQGKDKPEVGGLEGQVEMGRCAFSSAGPWMVGRKERKEGWLRGERVIALQPGELEEFSRKETEEKAEHAAGEVQDNTRAESESSVDDENSGPTTPALEEQLSEVSIRADNDSEKNQHMHQERLSTKESARRMAEAHPDTRIPQTGDLHVAS